MLFINNKYTKWYFLIIESAITSPYTGYTENHHIIPKSLGGSDADNNLVHLSARQHYVCHLLLSKMVDGSNKSKMFFALWSMSIGTKTKKLKRSYKVSSRLYEYARLNFSSHISETMSGKTKTPEHIEKIASQKRGKKLPRTVCEICGREISVSVYNRSHGSKCGSVIMVKMYKTCEVCGKKVDAGNFAQYHGKKCGNGQIRPKKICEHCSMEISYTNYTRWHGNNCKLFLDK